MSLHDPEMFARIVQSFIDIQKHEGWIPECRGATLQQHTQGGSGMCSNKTSLVTSYWSSRLDGDPIVAEFFIKYAQSIFLGHGHVSY